MILLTGATGLLGMQVLYDLTKKGHQVRALYRSPDRIKRVKKLFKFYDAHTADDLLQKVTWFQADIEDQVALQNAFEGIEKVIHCAAFVSFKNDDFRKLININRYGTQYMVDLAVKNKVQWFCHVSSTAAIGKSDASENLMLTEDAKWPQDAVVSGYAMSKYLAEKEVWRGIEEGLPAAIVNPSVILGPGDWNESSLTIFRTVKRGLKFYSPGANAVVDVRDVSKRMIFLMDQNRVNDRFLIVGENLPFRRLMDVIADRLGKQRPKYAVKPWLMGVAWRVASFVSFITRRPTALTKDATKAAFSTTSYSTQKMDAIYNQPYFSTEDSVDLVVRFEEF
jgi:dihydroflavonol-4-reductase